MQRLGLAQGIALAACALCGGAAACSSFGASEPGDDAGATTPDAPPSRSSDGGDEDAPGGSTTGGCRVLGAGSPPPVFCADFDSADPFANWTQPDEGKPGSTYRVDEVRWTSSPRSAQLSIDAPSGSPDTQLRRELGTYARVTVRGRLWIATSTGAVPVLLRLRFDGDFGSASFRSDGTAGEMLLNPDGGQPFYAKRFDSEPLPQDRWVRFVFDADLVNQRMELRIDDGPPRTGDLRSARGKARKVNLDVGPADPRQGTLPRFDMWLDDVVVAAE